MVDFTPTCAALSAYAAEANAMHTYMKLVGTESAVQSAFSFSIIIVKRRLYSLESHLALNRLASSFPSLVPLSSCLCSLSLRVPGFPHRSIDIHARLMLLKRSLDGTICLIVSSSTQFGVYGRQITKYIPPPQPHLLHLSISHLNSHKIDATRIEAENYRLTRSAVWMVEHRGVAWLRCLIPNNVASVQPGHCRERE